MLEWILYQARGYFPTLDFYKSMLSYKYREQNKLWDFTVWKDWQCQSWTQARMHHTVSQSGKGKSCQMKFAKYKILWLALTFKTLLYKTNINHVILYTWIHWGENSIMNIHWTVFYTKINIIEEISMNHNLSCSWVFFLS